MPTELPNNLLCQLSPTSMRWYALQKGWKLVEGVKRPLIVMNHPTDGLTQIHIPTAGDNRDVAFLMGDAIEKLAQAENKPARELLVAFLISEAIERLGDAIEKLAKKRN